MLNMSSGAGWDLAVQPVNEPKTNLKDQSCNPNMNHPRTSSPDKDGRASFSSVREDDSNLVQSFTSSKVSSYSRAQEEAVDDDAPITTTPGSSDRRAEMSQTQLLHVPPMTNPQSRLHGCWFPAVAADSFKGWKHIDVRGKKASRSFDDLQALRIVWDAPPSPVKVKKHNERFQPGQAPIEKLPPEVLGPIIELLVLDIPPNGVTARNIDLMSLLLTSRTLHSATLTTLYKYITIPHSRIFRKFLAHVSEHSELGTIVRRLDFSHFNGNTLFTTASERAEAQDLTSKTLLQCLELTPFLREFLAQEYIDDDLSGHVIRKLLVGLPRLKAVDFCGCSSPSFKKAFESVLLTDWPESLSISRFSLHRCMTLPSKVFDTILPRLGNLTHLDLAGTKVTDYALMSIPHTARITHLNLAKCSLLTAETVIDFLANHPAVKDSLIYLSLGTDARSHQLLDTDDVTKVLQSLPSTLRSLNLKGSRMDSSHTDLLRTLTKNLEELSIGRRLKQSDVDRLFIPDEGEGDDASMELDWAPHNLKYIDISDIGLEDLDITELFSSRSALLKKFSTPLEVIEIASDVYRRLVKSKTTLERAGWAIREFGSRAWLVRLHDAQDGVQDSGYRSWKMGASFWGARKIAMADVEVGGMYGLYMFQRRL